MSARSLYYQLVLLWVRHSAVFEEYLHQMAPVVARYGGKLDRQMRPTAVWAKDMTVPDMINLVHYDDKEAFLRFKDDPDFQRIVHLRSESVDLLSFEGHLVTANPSTQRLTERLYHVELANYRDGWPDAYRRYEREGEATMRRYGFAVEYALAVDTGPGDRPVPDIAKVSYFPDAAAKAAFERDPNHKVIEEQLYPAATENSIWITATYVTA